MCGIYGALLILGLFISCDGQSPCPNIFDYKSDGVNVYGVIVLKSSSPVSSLLIRVNFTIAARLPFNYPGNIEPVGSGLLLQNFNRGAPLTYHVYFPVTSPLPKLTSLVANDNIICTGPGDVLGQNAAYVSTITLQHMLYLKSEQRPGFNQQNPSAQNPNQVYDINLPSDDKIYSIDINRDGYIGTNNENTNNFSFETDDNSRPEHDRPIIIRPNRPEYTIIYPERTTQPYRQTVTSKPPPRPEPEPSKPVYTPPPPVQPPASPTAECGVIEGGNGRLPLIYNGESYSRGEWPWLVAIYRRKEGSLSFICSGTLISDRHVVTAAHCMHQKNRFTSQRDIVVKVGVYNLDDWGDEITVTRTLSSAVVHESYNTTTLANDILLLTFDRSVEFSVYIRPACLWNGDTDLSRIVGKVGVVAGWGQSEIGPSGQGEPRMVRIPVVSTQTCRESNLDFFKLTSQNTMCAGDRKGSGPCLGDSGGGLYMSRDGRWRLRGIVSLSLRPESGESTCNLNQYIVFTDSAKYLNWISNVMYT